MQTLRISIMSLYVCAAVSCDDSTKVPAVTDAGNMADAAVGPADITAIKRQSLCDASDKWAQNVVLKADFKTAACRFTAFFAAAAAGGATSDEMKASCVRAHDECLTDNAVAMPLSQAMCELPINCDVEPGEMQTCMEDLVATLKTTFASFPSCDTLAPGDFDEARLQQSATLHSTPASCAAVESKCQGFLLSQ